MDQEVGVVVEEEEEAEEEPLDEDEDEADEENDDDDEEGEVGEEEKTKKLTVRQRALHTGQSSGFLMSLPYGACSHLRTVTQSLCQSVKPACLINCFVQQRQRRRKTRI